jgi:hypothetical protein
MNGCYPGSGWTRLSSSEILPPLLLLLGLRQPWSGGIPRSGGKQTISLFSNDMSAMAPTVSQENQNFRHPSHTVIILDHATQLPFWDQLSDDDIMTAYLRICSPTAAPIKGETSMGSRTYSTDKSHSIISS